MQRAKRCLRQRFNTDRSARRRRFCVLKSCLQPWQPLCLETEMAPWDACFALGRRAQRCFGRITRRYPFLYRAGCVFEKHASPLPLWRFWSPGEPSRRRQVPKQTRVGAPQTTFCQEHHKPSSATRDSTRTHSVPQPAATSFGKSLPLPAFLLLSLRDALRYQAWRGWQRTSGLAHARPPHGLPQPRRG